MTCVLQAHAKPPGWTPREQLTEGSQPLSTKDNTTIPHTEHYFKQSQPALQNVTASSEVSICCLDALPTYILATSQMLWTLMAVALFVANTLILDDAKFLCCAELLLQVWVALVRQGTYVCLT